ncbi:MAG: hypothetical protein CSA05_00915 [Bacteroidia bacterium]|nr:MAG: hypothetical protein CSA05_00915 [Bacteroidia bacterium]
MFNSSIKIIKLNYKIGITIVLCIVFTVALSLYYSYATNKESRLKNVKNEAIIHAQHYSEVIATEIEQYVFAAQTLAKTLVSVKNVEDNPSLNRNQVNSLLRNFILYKKNITAVGIFWEPNSFDEHDEQYKNNSIYGRTGNFASYWYKSGQNRISRTPYFEGYIAPFYVKPKKNKKPMIVPPHIFRVQGKGKLVNTIVYPILYHGKFLGIITLDVLIKNLTFMIDVANLYNSNAKMTIISHDGTVVASTTYPEMEGNHIKHLFNDYEKQIAALLRSEQNTELDENFLKVNYPINIEGIALPWQLRLQIPRTEIASDLSGISNNMIYLVLFIILLCIVVTLSFTNYLLRPLSSLSEIASKLAVGDVNINIKAKNTGKEIVMIDNTLTKLKENFSNISELAGEIGKGNLEIEITPLGKDDVLGNSLIEMRNSLRQAKELDEKRKIEDTKRTWATEGLALFNEILRTQSDNIETLAYNIMNGLVNYLETNQGALFVYNDEDQNDIHLQMIVAIAYGERRYMQKKIKLGEGLLGTCAIEKHTVYMKSIPENYIEITSGLGGANPNFLLLVPLVLNQEILGIIELASFKEMQEYEIEFIEKLAESIASTISVTKVNIRTNLLLELTKKQSQELTTQEEEMRQNLEELKATQEEMMRKEKYMKELAEEVKMQEKSLIKKLEQYSM